MRIRAGSKSSWRQGFTLTEVLIASILSVILLAILVNVYKGICLPTRDAAKRCRVALRANLAVAALAQDFGGNLVDPYSTASFQSSNPGLLVNPEGTTAWRFVCWDASDSTQLKIYYRPQTDDDTSTTGKPTDALITYSTIAGSNGDQLVRSNSLTGTTITVADGLVAEAFGGGSSGFSYSPVNEGQWLSITLVFSAVNIAPKVLVNEENQLTYNVVVQPPS